MYVEVCLSYCGANFDGWAFNRDLNSIERQAPSLYPLWQLHMFSGVLFEALQAELGLEKLMLSCAGRTDKGVSSCGQVHSLLLPCCLQRICETVFVGHVFLYMASNI